MKRNKFNAKKTVVDGIRFDSMAEAQRYKELSIMLSAGDIRDLWLQPSYPIEINGHKICRVVLDFRYRTADGQEVIEDVKGMDTAISRLKRKMVEAQYGIKVVIVR